MNYVEIYADDEGVSHFRDVSIKLAEGVVAPPALPLNLSEFRPASEVGFITIPPGWVGLKSAMVRCAAFRKGRSGFTKTGMAVATIAVSPALRRRNW